MSADLSNSSGKDWTDAAADYAELMKKGPMTSPIRALLESMNRIAPFSSAHSIVDVGCGPGTVITELINTYGTSIPATTPLTASDYSEGMVAQVRQTQTQHSRTNPHWARLQTHVWNLSDLAEVANNSFSHIAASFVFFFLPDPRHGLTNTLRVLRPDGLLGLTSWHTLEWIDLFALSAANIRPDLVATRSAFAIPSAWSTTEAVEKELRETGFEGVEVRYVETWLGVEDPEALVRFFIRGKVPFVLGLIEGFSESEVAAVCEGFVGLVRERKRVEPRGLKGMAIVATGRKGGSA